MNVLLLSMPDYFEHMPPVAVRMPNGALTSLAGNIDSHHRVAVADLILSHRQVRETVTGLVREVDRALGDDLPAPDGGPHHRFGA
jgi:anaerobic magnesium-protoporphyrin IX monomethyl ester cyclase